MSEAQEPATRGIEIQIEPGLSLTVLADQPGNVRIFVQKVDSPRRREAEADTDPVGDPDFVNELPMNHVNEYAPGPPPVRHKRQGRPPLRPTRLADQND